MILAAAVPALLLVALIVERHLDRRAWAAERRHLIAIIAARHPADIPLLERPPLPARPAQRDDTDARPPALIGG